MSARAFRLLTPEEYGGAVDLCSAVFLAFEVSDGLPEGGAAFQRAIRQPAYLATLRMYGAFEGESLVGVLATRDAGRHIALFFVDGRFHRQGIGRRLFQMARDAAPDAVMDVHASRYAVEVYRRLGFLETGCEQVESGIRYTPMILAPERG